MSDASIVYITDRSLTMAAPGMGVYHKAAMRGYGQRTGCGITIWSNDQREWTLVPLRRDIATCFARLCERCFTEAPEQDE